MLPSSDSFAFGYADFYHAYLSIPFNRSLVELSGIPLPSPGVFSVHNPLHVVVAAQHGHQIFPIDEASFKARVKDDAPYASNVQARMDEFKQMLEDFNAEQKRLSIYMGGSVTFVIDDTPFTIEQFEMFGLGDTILAQAAMQFERDRNFHRLRHSARLNHFAQEYDFRNFQELMSYLGELDLAAQRLGVPSYAVMCTTSRYIDHVIAQSGRDTDMEIAIAALGEQRALLMRESVFMVERFVACRVAGTDVPFHIEILEEGVSIELKDGLRAEKAIVSSKHRSDKHDQIHPRWFV